MKILALDPSVNQTGWATLEYNRVVDSISKKVRFEDEAWNWGMWDINGNNFMMRCSDIKNYIQMEIGEFDELVVEWPMYYHSARGQIAAQAGFTINLAGINMYIAGFFQLPYQSIFLYTAPQWKGNVGKQVTARRFFKHFGVNPLTVDHNAVDATMMLVHHVEQQKLAG